MKPFSICAVLVPLALAAAVPAAAQPAADTAAAANPWKFGTALALNLSQSSFSTNWAGGDRGSIVWVFSSNSSAEKQFGTRVNLANLLQLAYGQTSRQQQRPNSTDRFWESPAKTTDQIAFESTARLTLGGWVDPYASFRLDSQFRDESYAPLAVLGFNPVKLKESAGIAKVLEKTETRETKTRLGFGLRQTLARSVDIVTLAESRFSTNDGGIEWQTQMTRPMLDQKVLYKGELLVFQPLFYSLSDELEAFDARVLAGDATRPATPGAEAVADFWKATDVSFQNTFTAQITRHLSVSLFAQWIYDKFDAAANVDLEKGLDALGPEVLKNVRKAGQFKETLALGLTYQLF